jgi:hypothetical protein
LATCHHFAGGSGGGEGGCGSGVLRVETGTAAVGVSGAITLATGDAAKGEKGLAIGWKRCSAMHKQTRDILQRGAHEGRLAMIASSPPFYFVLRISHGRRFFF